MHIALAVAASLCAALAFGFLWSVPLWLGTVFVLQFFRDPKRRIPDEPNITVAPADGKVVFTGTAPDPFLQRDAFKISVFMNVFSVHSNRIPVSGRVERIWYVPGKFINAVLDKSSVLNERNAVWIKTDDGDDVVVVQVAGLIARRILCYLKAGQYVRRGERYGFIRFGSRVDLYLPPAFRSGISLGDWVHAGEDVFGYFAAQAEPTKRGMIDERQARV